MHDIVCLSPSGTNSTFIQNLPSTSRQSLSITPMFCAVYLIVFPYGNVYIVVDMELKGRIREALIKMILGFDIEDMDLEPEE